MMCVVNKAFIGNGEDWIRNQLVDSSVFRNGPALIATRLLRPASADEIASAQVVQEPEPPVRKRSGLKVRIAKRG
jgi:hypothetical protein